uniref:Beta-1,4-N-acetylgalactosaminyltransferase n=1 Tax=Amblyomma parvum TaxID=251391 RepID=A0A023FZA8_AMBPA
MLICTAPNKGPTANGREMTAMCRFAARILCKLLVGVALAILLAHLCFDTTRLRHATYDALFVNLTSLVQAPAAADTEKPSLKPKTTPAVTNIPNDVLSDGNRSNLTAENICPLIPPNLVGYIPTKMDVASIEAVEDEFPDVMMGGRFRPKNCTSRHRVAILIPYRDRAEHLKIFIYNIHRVLARQQVDYGVFVIEQGDQEKFNRAKLLNVGYLESTALYDYQCFVFHDIDLVPADDRNIYTCPQQPRHMSVRIDYRSGVPYTLMFGGVSSLNKEHMLLVNGFSNLYWGWGGEDDDISFRLKHFNLTILRRPAEIARYTSLRHVKNKPSPERHKILAKWKDRYKTDGLNSVKYKIMDIQFKKLYTWIVVDLRES